MVVEGDGGWLAIIGGNGGHLIIEGEDCGWLAIKGEGGDWFVARPGDDSHSRVRVRYDHEMLM